jgi:hypothetical protein
MMVILAAAALAATPAPPPEAAPAPQLNPAPERVATSTPNMYRVPEHCRNQPYQVVDSHGRPVAIRLGDLPEPGGLQLLVDRRIDGCRVITVRNGTVARDQPNPPMQSYRVRPLEGFESPP